MFSKNPKMPCRDLNELYPYMAYLAKKLIDQAKIKGITIIITQTYRNAAYQQSLYDKGRKTPGKIVTNCKPGQSPHEFRSAFDICIIKNGKADYSDTKAYQIVGAIGESIGLTWGGHFKSFKDMPHFEKTMGLTLRQLRAGQTPKYPPIPVK